MAGLLKKTTGLTGLVVARNPHKSLAVLYEKILKTLEKMPKDAAYRKYTGMTIQERLSAVNSIPNVTKLEEHINSGQVEQLIVQAENELLLSRKMLQWKPWEPLVGEAPNNQWKWPV